MTENSSIGLGVYNFLKENRYVFDIKNTKYFGLSDKIKPFQTKHWFSRWYTTIASKKPSIDENNNYFKFIGLGGNENIFNFLREYNDPEKDFDENEKKKILYMINYPYYSYNYKISIKSIHNNNNKNKNLTDLKEIKRKNAENKRYEFIDIYMNRCEKDEERLKFACYAYLSFLKNYKENDFSDEDNKKINDMLLNLSNNKNDYDEIMKSFCENIVNKHEFGYNNFIGNCNTDSSIAGKKIRRNRKSKKVKKSRKKRKSRRKSYNSRGRH